MTAAAFDVSIEVTPPEPEIDTSGLLVLAANVMEGEEVAAGTGLSILVTDDEEVRSMNNQFLGIDAPTDVLSFPDDAPDFVQAESEPFLGDIAIALPTAARQAVVAGHSLDAELRHLLVHGILHLCGYDHEVSPEEETRMRQREEHYLGDLKHIHAH
ncbi:MAG: rRNA maturation RNase YbeY [Tepidiformaceae bacterium]